MTSLTRGKRRPAITTTSQVNAVTPESFENGCIVWDDTINKFKYWDGTIWRPIPGDFIPAYGEQELASDVNVDFADGVKEVANYAIDDSGVFLVQVEAYVNFAVEATTAANTLGLQLRDTSTSGTVIGQTWLSQKRSGNIVHGSVMGFITNPTDVKFCVSTIETAADALVVKSYTNNGTIGRWLRIG